MIIDLTKFKSVSIDPDMMVGDPCLRDRRMTIAQVIECTEDAGAADFCYDFNVDPDLVQEFFRELRWALAGRLDELHEREEGEG